MSISFNEYQNISKETAIYPKDKELALAYVALGLNGEAGEVAEIIKKLIRDCENLNEHDMLIAKDKICKEVGDVLWYLSAICCEFDLTFNEVAQTNINKLQSRKNRNKLKGSGDDR